MEKIPLRIALRVEGRWWIAYLAKPRGMEDALEIARVLIRPARENPAIKQAFIDLSKLIIDDATRATGLTIEGWNPPEVAPEDERSGTA